MSNTTQNSQSAPANKAARSFSRFVRTSVKPVVFKLSRKLSVTYWPGRRRTISAMLLAMLSGFVPGLVAAAPTGGQVVAGSATILKPTSTTTQVNQASQNAVINWQTFSIGAGEAVRFVQPSASAVALNRVIGADPSRIFGSLTANGKVFLVNSAGVYFAPGASVDVGGLVASSMNISNASFMSGKYKFDAGAGAGAGEVVNAGQLRGAFVVLAAPQVSNSGSIVTTGGATALAAGGRVSLDIAGDKLVSLSVDAATANAAVQNSGSISADGGKVFMSASSANAVLDTVINTTGIVRAGSIGMRNGQIVIDGGSAGVVKVGGTLAASGAGAGARGGAVQVVGDKVALLAGASIDVSGDTGGGSALVGGDLHGAGAVRTASMTQVEQGAVINADALTSGSGGKVVVWSNEHTGFAGAISAKGGAQGGDGGYVETSGKHTLAFAGKVSTTAARGATGTLLLDPTDITISSAATANGGGLNSGTFTGSADNSTLNVADLTTALGSNNVVVDTASSHLGAGNITVDDAVTWTSANSLTLKATQNISVNQPITSNGSGGINLYGDGAIMSSSLTSSGGAINIAGNAGGSSRAGSVNNNTIASNGGNVSVRSQGGVFTGNIDAGSGTIMIEGQAGVAITGALATTNTGASAIIVKAGASHSAGDGSGGDITVAGGSVAVGAGGYATLYTGSVAGSTGLIGPVGSGMFRYGSDESVTNFNTISAPLTAGVSAVYRESPLLTVSSNSASITYGDALPGFTPTISGLKNGDTNLQALSSQPTAIAGGTLSTSGHKNAGTHAVTVSGAVDQLGYSVSHVNGSLTVAQKSLTSAGSTVADRAYDGTTAATVNASATTFGSGAANSGDGLAYAGDVVSVNNAGVHSAVFADKNAAAGKAVTINSIALQGADAGNYVLTGSATAAITPKALTATATAADKVYDGNTAAATALTLSGLVGTEQLGVVSDGTFNSKDVVTANTVTINTVTLADGANGGLANNYTLAPGQTATAQITPKELVLSVVAPDKVYDGNYSSLVTVSIDSGLVGSETLGISGTGVFDNKDVASASFVLLNSATLADGTGLASNYSVAASVGSGLTDGALITPKALTVTASTANKVYDGSTLAAPTLNITAGLVGSETVTATGSATFNSKDVLDANQVTVNTASLNDGTNGGLASNYSVTAGQTMAANITPKALALSITAPNKVYDGNYGSVVTVNAAGLVGAETLGISGTGVFDNKDVVTASSVLLNSATLADGTGLASNYSIAASLASGPTAAALITPKALTVTASTANKVYDGNNLAAATLDITSGLVGTETVTATGTATFNSKDVLTANQVTVNTASLNDGTNGGFASNYSVAAGQTIAASIAPKQLALSFAAPDKVYDGNFGSVVAVNIDSGLVGAETLGISGTGAFNNKDVVSASYVLLNSATLADGTGLASNYSVTASLASALTDAALITPKALTVAVPASKVYDGNNLAASTLNITSGLVGAETVTATGNATFNSKDVLTANQVTVNTATLNDGTNGGLASNYSVTPGQTVAASITPAALTISATASDKVYDGNAFASVSAGIAAGLVGTETLGVTGSGTFNSKDVLSANSVTLALALSDGANGGLASNYSAPVGQTTPASITAKALSATATVASKVYDGSNAAAAALNIDGAGLVGSETVSASGIATFNSQDVLTANLATVNSVTLADGANGGLASNYSLAAGQTYAAGITPAALALSASVAGKIYDGSVSTPVGLAVASGLVGSETLGVAGSGSFNSKDVVSANTVTLNSVTLSDGTNGGIASNYSASAGQTIAASIAPKALSATATVANKVYDGNATATAALSIDPASLVGGETVGATANAAFNSKDVASANIATVNAVVLADGTGGGLASNYSLAAGQTAVAHITPKALTATATAADKIYDGSRASAATMTIAAAGLVGGETVTATGSGLFNTRDVLTAHTVTVDSTALANGANGGLASNYSLGVNQTAAAHITPKDLTAVATASNKAYDGNDVAAATLAIDAAGLVGTETVTASGNATFNSKDVLTANVVTVNTTTLANGTNGGLASNYRLGNHQSAVAHIAPKALDATASAPNKVYDGSTLAAPVLAITAAGLVGTETVTATGTGTFNSKDVLSANLVTVNTTALANGANGGLASNYSLAAGETVTSHITPKVLNATAGTTTKVYDGNTAATTPMNIAAAGLVGSETVSAVGTGVFSSKNVNGTAANPVTVNSVVLANGANGGLASNYSLASGQTGAGVITQRPTVNWLGTVSTDWSNPANWEAGAIPDMANVANVVIADGKSVTFSSSVPTLNGAVSLDGISGAGGLTVSNGLLKVANALNIGSYAQAAGEVDAGAMKVTSSFSQTGGKIDASTGLVEINQAAGTVGLGDIKAARLSIGGGASVTQVTGSALTVSGATTLATGGGDVTLGNLNDFGEVSFISGHDVQLNDINAMGIGGSVGGNLKVSSASLNIASTTVGGSFSATAQGAIIQSGVLNVGGSTTLATAGTLQLDGTRSGAKVNVTTGGDANIVATGTVAIAGNIGGKLVLTATGAVNQTAGDALHVTGTSNIDAGTNAITLTEADNHFGQALTLKGGAVSVVDKGALVLGQSSVGGNFAVTAGGAVSQAGKLAVSGTTSIVARNNTVTLADATNSFGGKLTLDAVSAVIAAGVPLLVDASISSSLALTAPSLTVSSANPLNLHMTTGTATVNASKALALEGNVTGALGLTAGGAVTQGAALTVGGATTIDAAGQAVTLTNAGNDFIGDLIIKAAGATQVTDKNALSFGASSIGGSLQASAKGNVTQTGILNVTGLTAIDTTGAITLANEGNDFAGTVGGTASSVVLADKNVLTISKLTAPTVDLRAGTELQVAAGGMVDAADIALSLSAGGKKIGDQLASFEVRPNAHVVLGANTPAVPAYFGGAGATLTVLNANAKAAYVQEITPLFLGYGQVYRALVSDATSSVNASVAHSLTASQKKADSNADLIERGLPTDLTIPIPYPHEGKVRAKGPNCADGSAPVDGAGCDKLARADM